MRGGSIRDEVLRMVRRVRFRPIVLHREDGGRVAIGRPEHIAFDPAEGGSPYFYVISGQLRHLGGFDPVASVSTVEHMA